MIKKYYTNGSLDDVSGSGITVASFLQDDDGNWVGVQKDESGQPNLGYLPNEITETEYGQWRERIANPDMVTYFPGVFPGIGVVSADRHAQIVADREIQRKARAVVKRVQALQALNAVGVTKDLIYAQIGNLPAAQQGAALIWFEDSQTFQRSHPMVQMLGAALGFSANQLDDLFAEAAKIK